LAQLSAEEQLELAGLAIRAEFGEFIDLIHGGGAYFSLQHYLPEAVRYHGPNIYKDTKPSSLLVFNRVYLVGISDRLCEVSLPQTFVPG
jgi:hypothetical protein